MTDHSNTAGAIRFAPFAETYVAGPTHEMPQAFRLRAAGRLALFGLINVLLVPCGWLAAQRRAQGVDWWTGLYCQAVVRLLGLEVCVQGTPLAHGPALLVANHISYLDIVTMNSVTPLSFVAKAEVEGWPVFGWLTKLARTAYVRRVVGDAKKQQDQLVARLAQGDRLVIFPEGTSTDGSAVLPFKSSLLAVAEHMRKDGPFLVQPVSVRYEAMADGTPIAGPLCALYGWFGDAEFMPHLLRVFGLPGARVRLVFHEPIDAAQVRDRKHLTQLCESAVRAGIAPATTPAILPDTARPDHESL
jgi:lyso-ornithine lipid O-acyltransferase